MSIFQEINATGLAAWLCATAVPLLAFSCASPGAQQPPWEGCRPASKMTALDWRAAPLAVFGKCWRRADFRCEHERVAVKAEYRPEFCITKTRFGFSASRRRALDASPPEGATGPWGTAVIFNGYAKGFVEHPQSRAHAASGVHSCAYREDRVSDRLAKSRPDRSGRQKPLRRR